MTQKDKELLLKDLCARLPYNVKCKVHLDTEGYCLRDEDKYCDDTLESVNCRKQACTFNKSIGYNFGYFAIEEVKPYLRPMSSMTEEEKKELENYLAAETVSSSKGLFAVLRAQRHTTNFLYSKYLDILGLIEKGLAIEVTKENNPYEKR